MTIDITWPGTADGIRWYECTGCGNYPCTCHYIVGPEPDYQWINCPPVDYEKIREIVHQEIMKAWLIRDQGMNTYDEYEEALEKAEQYDKLKKMLSETGLWFAEYEEIE